MALSFTPKTEQQIMDERLLAKGIYKFRVVDCEEKQGQMCPYFRIKFALRNNGKEFTWYDNLVISESFLWKLRHACEEMGIIEQYNKGSLEYRHFLNKEGIVIIDHRVNKKNNTMEAYVRDYGDREAFKPTSNTFSVNAIHNAMIGTMQQPATEFVDDDVPF